MLMSKWFMLKNPPRCFFFFLFQKINKKKKKDCKPLNNLFKNITTQILQKYKITKK